MLGLLGLRIFEACGASIDNLAEEHGHRVRKVRGKGGKTVLIPLPPAVDRAIDRAVDGRDAGPILHNAPRVPNGPAPSLPPAQAAGRYDRTSMRGCTRTCSGTRS
jgi:integrase